MCEIIRAPGMAKVIGCSQQQVRYNLRHGVWGFGKVVKKGGKHFYVTTISELADFLGLSREEIIKRLEA